jgi:hypothetical protein
MDEEDNSNKMDSQNIVIFNKNMGSVEEFQKESL